MQRNVFVKYIVLKHIKNIFTTLSDEKRSVYLAKLELPKLLMYSWLFSLEIKYFRSIQNENGHKQTFSATKKKIQTDQKYEEFVYRFWEIGYDWNWMPWKYPFSSNESIKKRKITKITLFIRLFLSLVMPRK